MTPRRRAGTRLAADQGARHRAQNNLGVMYADGEGVPEDDAEDRCAGTGAHLHGIKLHGLRMKGGVTRSNS